MNALFSPTLSDTADLERCFVQRGAMVDTLLDEIRRALHDGTSWITVLLGARGLGKSHLAALVARRVGQLPEDERPAIAWLPQHAWGVMTFDDVSAALREELREASRRNAASGKAGDLEELLGARRLLLFADDLDRLLAGMKRREQKRLRDFLLDQRAVFLATSLRPLGSVAGTLFDHTARTQRLEPLRFAESCELIERLLTARRPELLTALHAPDGETALRVLHHLAAGNHRMVTRFALALEGQEDLREPVGALLQAVDALTPESPWIARLSPQQRKIVALLAAGGGALPVKGIARRCGMSQQTASSQLKTLRRHGELRATALGRESYYEPTDPCGHLAAMAQARRGDALRDRIALLRLWHGPSGLGRRLGTGATPEELVRELREAPRDPRAWQALAQALTERDRPVEVEICENALARLLPDSPGLLNSRALRLYRLGDPARARDMLEHALALAPGVAVVLENYGLTLAALGAHREALRAFEKAIAASRERADGETAGAALHGAELGPRLQRAALLDILGRSDEVEATWDDVLADLRGDAARLTTEPAALLRTLLMQSREPEIWAARITPWIERFAARRLEIPLAYALLHTLPTLLAEWLPLQGARAWAQAWRQCTEPGGALSLSLRWIDAALDFRQVPDPRPLLSLSPPERQVLGPLLTSASAPLSDSVMDFLESAR